MNYVVRRGASGESCWSTWSFGSLVARMECRAVRRLDGVETHMDEVDVAPALSAARLALEEWNQSCPQSWTPWEWLEEALLARRRWKRAGRKSPALAARNYQR